MAGKVVLGDFDMILSKAKTVLAAGIPIPDPFKDATTIDVFEQTVADGRNLLASRYQQRYVDVLDQVVQQAKSTLLSLHPRAGDKRQLIFEQLQDFFSRAATPIVQFKSSKYRRELKAFLAAISSIYGRFVNSALVQQGTRFNILAPDLDPLGYFGHDEAGPLILPACEDMPVSIVSKPAREMNFLPLWATDGHEVGGHGIYGAVQGLQAELTNALETNIRSAFQSGQIKTSQAKVNVPYRGLFTSYKTITMEEFMVRVWRAWMLEVISDFAGLGNIGPMYLDALMLLLCIVRPNNTLSKFGGVDSTLFADTNGFDVHPIDTVRILLCLEALKKQYFPERVSYADELLLRLQNNQIKLPQTVSWQDCDKKRVIDVALTDLLATFPVVIATLLERKLSCLANQSLVEITNWQGGDEAIVKRVALQLIAGDTNVATDVEARHVLAASMLACELSSVKPDFAKISTLIHETGINILQEMYDSRCLLFSVCAPPVPSGITRTIDMIRLFQNIKNQRIIS